MKQLIPSTEEFLAEFPVPIQQLSLSVGFLIKETVAHVIERVYPGWRLIGYRQGTDKKSRYFCFVAPYRDHVRLGFEYGAWMEDPWELLQGRGSQVRHVCIRTSEEGKNPHLPALILQAARLAALPRHELLLLPSYQTKQEKKACPWS